MVWCRILRLRHRDHHTSQPQAKTLHDLNGPETELSMHLHEDP